MNSKRIQKQLNELRKTMQDIEEGFNSGRNSEKFKMKF
jgi:hypothetical protein